MGTNASLSLLPLQPVCCLCCLTQERLHVAAWHPGHLYLDTAALHILHKAAAGGPAASTAAGDTILLICLGTVSKGRCCFAAPAWRRALLDRTNANYRRSGRLCVFCCTRSPVVKTVVLNSRTAATVLRETHGKRLAYCTPGHVTETLRWRHVA